MSNTGGSNTAQETGPRKPRNAADQRITVALIPKVSDELQSLVDRTGLSKTDLANRAISLYEFIESQFQAGKELVVRDPATGQEQIVRLF